MSINVTVNGNPVSIRRRKVLLADPDDLKKNEFDRRRKLRLQQVRQQSKDMAHRLRGQFRNEKDKQQSQFEQEQTSEMKKQQARKLLNLQQKYQDCLEDVGMGHNRAAAEPDYEAYLLEQHERNLASAYRRGKEAGERAKREEARVREERMERAEQQKLSRTVEDLRSTMISSIGKRQPKATKRTKTDKPLREIDRNVPCYEEQETALKTVRPSKFTPKKKTTRKSKKVPPLYGIHDDESPDEEPSENVPAEGHPIKIPPLIGIGNDDSQIDLTSKESTFKRRPCETEIPESFPVLPRTPETKREGYEEAACLPQVKVTKHEGGGVPALVQTESRTIDSGASTCSDGLPRPCPPRCTSLHGSRPSSLQVEPGTCRNEPSARPVPPVDTCVQSCSHRTQPTAAPCVPTQSGTNGTLPTVSQPQPYTFLQPSQPVTCRALSHTQASTSHAMSTSSRMPRQPLTTETSEDSDCYCSEVPWGRRGGDHPNTPVTPSAAPSVQYYDHSARYHRQYRPESTVERLSARQVDAVRAAQQEREREAAPVQWVQTVTGRVAQRARRGNRALERERVHRDYHQLLAKLGPLSREERLLRVPGPPPDVHQPDERRRARREVRQRDMDSAFERVLHATARPDDDCATVSSYATESRWAGVSTTHHHRSQQEPPATLNVGQLPRFVPPPPLVAPVEGRDDLHDDLASPRFSESSIVVGHLSEELPPTNNEMGGAVQHPSLESLVERINVQRSLLMREIGRDLRVLGAATNLAPTNVASTSHATKRAAERDLSFGSDSGSSHRSDKEASSRMSEADVGRVTDEGGRPAPDVDAGGPFPSAEGPSSRLPAKTSTADKGREESNDKTTRSRPEQTRTRSEKTEEKKEGEGSPSAEGPKEKKDAKKKARNRKEEWHINSRASPNERENSFATVVSEYSMDLTLSRTERGVDSSLTSSGGSSSSTYEGVKVVVSIVEKSRRTLRSPRAEKRASRVPSIEHCSAADVPPASGGPSHSGNTQSKSRSGHLQSESRSGNLQSESQTGNTQSDLRSSNTQSGSRSGNLQSESCSGNLQSESQTGNTQSDLRSSNTQSGSRSGNTQESQTGNTQSDLRSSNTQSGSRSGNTQRESQTGNAQRESRSDKSRSRSKSRSGNTRRESQTDNTTQRSKSRSRTEGSKTSVDKKATVRDAFKRVVPEHVVVDSRRPSAKSPQRRSPERRTVPKKGTAKSNEGRRSPVTKDSGVPWRRRFERNADTSSASTSYVSPPGELSVDVVSTLLSTIGRRRERLETWSADLGARLASQQNPCLAQYVMRLLAMSRDRVDELSVDVSDVPTPCSSVVGDSGNLNEDSMLLERLVQIAGELGDLEACVPRPMTSGDREAEDSVHRTPPYEPTPDSSASCSRLVTETTLDTSATSVICPGGRKFRVPSPIGRGEPDPYQYQQTGPERDDASWSVGQADAADALHLYEGLAQECAERITDLSRRLERVRAEKRTILERSPRSTESFESTRYESPPPDVVEPCRVAPPPPVCLPTTPVCLPTRLSPPPVCLPARLSPPPDTSLVARTVFLTGPADEGRRVMPPPVTRPPPALWRNILRNDIPPTLAHELSAILEVDQQPSRNVTDIRCQPDSVSEGRQPSRNVTDIRCQPDSVSERRQPSRNVTDIRCQPDSVSERRQPSRNVTDIPEEEKECQPDEDVYVPDVMAEMLRRRLITSPLPYAHGSGSEEGEGGEEDTEESVSFYRSILEHRHLGVATAKGGVSPASRRGADSSTTPRSHRRADSSTTPRSHRRADSSTSPRNNDDSNSTTEELDGVFEQLGLGWAGATLRKTREAEELGSSSCSEPRAHPRPPRHSTPVQRSSDGSRYFSSEEPSTVRPPSSEEGGGGSSRTPDTSTGESRSDGRNT